jgi:phage repressor protein C with HTH and peptisase S24 domain
MLKHAHVWRAVDRLAREYGFTTSGLARRAGLDPTTFNKSKRTTREGKLRWPSTESVAKILEATGATLAEFVSYASDGSERGVLRNLPLIGFAQAGAEDRFDENGRPTGKGWDEIPFPELDDPGAYAIEIGGEDLAPVYRDGDIIVLSPHAGVRRGDRVVVKTRDGKIMIGTLRRRTGRRIELQTFGSAREVRPLAADEVERIVRILWASQ